MSAGATTILFLFLVASVSPIHAAVQQKAPAFSERDLEGYLQSTSKYAGKPLVLYFWATWCPACVNEVKKIKKIWQNYHSKGIHFVSVSLDEDKDKLEKFIEEKDIRYPVLFDGTGWKNEIVKKYSVVSTPTFVLIGADGNIQTSGGGINALEKELKKLV